MALIQGYQNIVSFFTFQLITKKKAWDISIQQYQYQQCNTSNQNIHYKLINQNIQNQINKYISIKPSHSFIKLTQNYLQPRKKAMQNPTDLHELTPLQSLILQLSHSHYPKADQTFYALPADPPDPLIANKSQKQIQKLNNNFMDKFGVICLGNEKHAEIGGFRAITAESATLFIKETEINNKLIRLVYFPLLKWDLTGENGAVSYKKMVMQQMLFTHFLKPTLTTKYTLISLSRMLPGQAEDEQDVPVLQLKPHLDKISKQLLKIFKLEVPEIRLKMIYVVCINARKDKILFGGEINKDKKIYILTHDNLPRPLFALDPTEQQNFGLKTEPTDLLKKENYVIVPELYKHFSYNEFVHFKPTRQADVNLGLKISDEIWAIYLAILNPLCKIKQIIYNEYSLGDIKVQGDGQPAPYPDLSSWKNGYEIKADYCKINQIFKFEQWNERENQSKHDSTEESLVKHEKPEEKRLVYFTQMINLNTEFLHEEPKFIHSMVLTQINNLWIQLEEQNKRLQSENDPPKRFILEKKVLEYGKIIVRLLGSLKNNKSFSHLLNNFEPKFYEHLLTIYANAHDDFCRANKGAFNKLFDLVTKFRQLKSVKLQLLKILKFNQTDVKWQKSRENSLEQAKRKKKKLQILLNLLLENQTNEEDREIKKKIFVVKFDLALTLKKLAIELDFGNKKSKYLKKALKIVFVDLYKNLFHDNKNFSTEYSTGIGFSDDILLKEASSLLKMMGRIDLSIELQKKMGRHKIVAEYYKYRLMQFRGELQKDVSKMRQIIISAIVYFKAKLHMAHVSEFYDLLIETGKSKEERDNFDKERLDYEMEMGDPVNKRRFGEAAKTKMFPLVDNNGNNNKDTVKDIQNMCVVENEEKNNMNSSIFEK